MADNRYRDEGGWRGERGRERSNSIFGDNDRERERHGGGDDRGFMEQAGEKLNSWLGGDDDRGGGSDRGRSHYGSEHGYGGFQGDYGGGGGQGGFGGQGDYGGGRQSFSGGGRFGGGDHSHYLKWRDRQIAELDRDYEEYCRERQQQFHSDFDGWRQSRQGQSGLGASASTGSSGDEGGSVAGGTASSRTSTLLGGSDEGDFGGTTGQDDTETAGTGLRT